MLVKVLEPFIDRFTNQYHEEGKLLHVSAERCAELAPLGFVEPVEEKTAEEKPKRRRAVKKA